MTNSNYCCHCTRVDVQAWVSVCTHTITTSDWPVITGWGRRGKEIHQISATKQFFWQNLDEFWSENNEKAKLKKNRFAESGVPQVTLMRWVCHRSKNESVPPHFFFFFFGLPQHATHVRPVPSRHRRTAARRKETLDFSRRAGGQCIGGNERENSVGSDSVCTRVFERFGDHSAEREEGRAFKSGDDGDDGGADTRGSLDWIARDGSECTLHDGTQQDGVSKASLGVGDK